MTQSPSVCQTTSLESFTATETLNVPTAPMSLESNSTSGSMTTQRVSTWAPHSPPNSLKNGDVTDASQRVSEPALRFDAGKPRYDLLPPDALEELVMVYTKGAAKYADRNWEKGMSWSRCFGSLMRHSWKFWKGEKLDPETGCHHMAMAAWNALALVAYDMRSKGTDDRPI